MKILNVTKSGSLFDVFLGEGWKNWSRYKKVKDNFVFVNGTKLPVSLLIKIKEKANG